MAYCFAKVQELEKLGRAYATLARRVCAVMTSLAYALDHMSFLSDSQSLELHGLGTMHGLHVHMGSALDPG